MQPIKNIVVIVNTSFHFTALQHDVIKRQGKKAHLFLVSAQETILDPPGPSPAEEGADGHQRGSGPAARPLRGCGQRAPALRARPGTVRGISQGNDDLGGVDGARKDFFFFLIKGKKKRNQAIEADPSFSASRCPCTPRDRQQADAVKSCGEVGQWAEGL